MPKENYSTDAKKPADAPPVPFSHKNHAEKNYSIDGTKQIACVECHHTDQPAAEAAKKPPLKTGWPADRTTTLTADLLAKDPKAPNVISCRACHAQAGAPGYERARPDNIIARAGEAAYNSRAVKFTFAAKPLRAFVNSTRGATGTRARRRRASGRRPSRRAGATSLEGIERPTLAPTGELALRPRVEPALCEGGRR